MNNNTINRQKLIDEIEGAIKPLQDEFDKLDGEPPGEENIITLLALDNCLCGMKHVLSIVINSQQPAPF